MYQRPPMTFPAGLRQLRRWWFVPVGAAVLGAVLGFAAASSATIETAIRLTPDPSLAFISAALQQPEPVTDLTSDALATQLTAGLPDFGLPEDSDVSISASPDTLLIVVNKSSVAEARAVADKYVDAVRTLRKERDQQTSEMALTAINAGRDRLEQYLNDSPEGTTQIVVSKADAATRLADLDVAAAAAGQLAQSDGRVTASSVDKSSSPVPQIILLSLGFGALGVVAVLVLGPMSRRIRNSDDLDSVLKSFGGAPVFSTKSSGTVELPGVVSGLLANHQAVSVVPLRGAGTAARALADSFQVTAEMPAGFAELTGNGAVILMAKRGDTTLDDVEAACRTLTAAHRPIGALGLIE